MSSYRAWLGLLAGLSLTSISLSSGFIWACGAACVTTPIVWSSTMQPILVFIAALCAWWGYLFAHYAWTGNFIDVSAHDDANVHNDTASPETLPIPMVAGVVAGAGVLVVGMVIGVIFIRNGNHVMTNIGGIFFLGGYVIAHYFETGAPL